MPTDVFREHLDQHLRSNWQDAELQQLVGQLATQVRKEEVDGSRLWSMGGSRGGQGEKDERKFALFVCALSARLNR